MTDTDKQIADARAQLAAARDGNIVDRVMALERIVLQLLDLVENVPRAAGARIRP